MTPGILVRWVLQKKKKRPWEQKKCRRKVTKPSWEERERSFHCSRTAASMQALTIKIERVNRRRRDPSSVSVVERNSQGTSRLDSAEAGESDERQQTLHTQVLFSLPSSPHAVVCAVETLRSLEQDSRGKQAGVKAASWGQFHHNLRASRPGQVLPTGCRGGMWGVGRRGETTGLGFGKQGLG